jgi:hypothetical protein
MCLLVFLIDLPDTFSNSLAVFLLLQYCIKWNLCISYACLRKYVGYFKLIRSTQHHTFTKKAWLHEVMKSINLHSALSTLKCTLHTDMLNILSKLFVYLGVYFLLCFVFYILLFMKFSFKHVIHFWMFEILRGILRMFFNEICSW